jgi:glycosyltransferase involved in cell wall biosynthesis
VGDYLTGVDSLPQPLWRKKLIKLWAYWNHRGQMNAVRRNLVFVNSRKIYEELKPFAKDIVETRTTSISKDDFYDVLDRCTKFPYRILLVGRIDKTKGLFELLESIKTLREAGIDIVSDIVGWSSAGDPTEKNLKKAINRFGLDNYVTLHGFKPLGPELFAYYINADIFVMPSYAEGFPRSIWEAMSHSVPVIATAVGAIPSLLTQRENVIMIKPQSSSFIASAIKELIDNPPLRQKLIRNAKILAAENTLEDRTQELAQQLKDYCKS